jgi:CRISPR/Cas system-associated endonuclease Cas3-HD
MAEVVGLAASIIQIAGAGAKLSVALYNFTTSAARADQDIRDIADDVELTSNALESVGKVFESEESKSIMSKKAIQDANNIIKKCGGVFNEVSEMLEKRRKVSKDGKKGLSVMGKLSWPMKEQKVELYRRRLESLKNSLVLLLHVLQLAQGQARGFVYNFTLTGSLG